MPRPPASRLIRWISLLVILPGAAGLLWPERKSMDAAGAGPSKTAAEYKYVLRMSVGQSYLPGSVPAGIGPPLQGFTHVVQAFEARFPDTKVEIVTVPIEREFLVTQLSGGAAPDIVCVNVEDVWVDAQKQWYVPLDRFLEAPNPFVAEKGDPNAPGARQWWDMFAYQAITRGKGAPDGTNYCISLDMVETGIFYNKTFFVRHGLRPPETWGEFITLMKRVQALGRTPLLSNVDCMTDWGNDLLFDQLYHPLMQGLDVKKDDAARSTYLQGYLDADEITFLHQRGYFTRRDPRFREVYRKMGELRQFLPKDVAATDIVRDFVNQRSPMIWNGSWFVYPLAMDHRLGFEWDVFYLPAMTPEDSPYAAGVPMCVIGGVGTQYEVTNTALGDTDPARPFAERIAQSERLRRVVALLQFVCLPENTDRIVNEYAAFIPNIVGVKVHPPLAPFAEILKRRYTTTKWVFTFDLRFNEILRRIMHLYLAGAIDLDEFMHWQEANVATATDNHLRRTNADLAPLQREWDRLAPQRAGRRDLPPEPPR